MAGETGMFMVHQTVGSVLCCKCGILMAPNAANMCVNCLRSEVDITESIQKHDTIMHCPECERWLQPPKTWIKADPESGDLLSFCLSRLKNLKKVVRLVHAEFVWTEPHSKRIKVKLKVQKEVLTGAVLEQAFIAEYVVQDHMCESCTRVQANPDQWVASVQLRQHIAHRRTFFYLEQLILKHDAAAQSIRIKQMDHGIDFFFTNRSHAKKFINFLEKVTPTKKVEAKQLVSHDTKSYNYNYKYTFSVEICPICREDLILLPPSLCKSLGNISPLVICNKVTNTIALLDPSPRAPRTPRICYLEANLYWNTPFRAVLSSRQLIEYIVLDIVVKSEHTLGGSKYLIAEAQVARVSDFGRNDTIFTIDTHLGHILNPGDYALGYDLYGANVQDIDQSKYKNFNFPDAILIKKSYEEKRRQKRGKPRSWKLKTLDIEDEDSRRKAGQEKDAEYEKFLEDLEENPELRFDISLYRNKEYQPSEVASMTDGDELPSIPLDELLGDLDLSEAEDGDCGMRE